jgi:low temperature requirement protein LtrA
VAKEEPESTSSRLSHASVRVVSEQHIEREQRVTPLELFFDLVFVFGFTQVTTVLSNEPNRHGLGHGILILAALWWAWAAYAWLTNSVDPGEALVWGTTVVAMGAMFVAALAVPEAFGRHGVVFGVAFLIIAIGESLVAIGFGARETALGAKVILAAVLGLVVVTSFWLAYFDFFTIRAQQLLADRSGAPQIALARDVYTYLHLPMVAGIVLFAFAMKTTLAHVGNDLTTVPAIGLCIGPALYLLAYVALRVRVSRSLGGGRLVAGLACVALLPVALVVPALAALALVAAVWVALHAYELIWWRDVRAKTRAQRLPASAS